MYMYMSTKAVYYTARAAANEGQLVRPASMNLLISAFPIFGGKTTKELVLRSTLPQDARHDWST